MTVHQESLFVQRRPAEVEVHQESLLVQPYSPQGGVIGRFPPSLHPVCVSGHSKLNAFSTLFVVGHATRGLTDAHLLALAAAGGIAILIHVDFPKVDTLNVPVGLIYNSWWDLLFNKQWKQYSGWFLAHRKSGIAPWRGSNCAKGLGKPSLGFWAALHGSDLPYGFAITNPMMWCAPSVAEPDAFYPTSFERDIHVFVRALSPEDSFTKLEAFFVDVFAEQPFIGRAPIDSSQILCGEISNMLHKPSHQRVFGGHAMPQFALQGQCVHSDDAFDLFDAIFH